MKRVINGRLWDDDFMNGITYRTFDVRDPVTGEIKMYREELKREYVLKPGHTLSDTWIESSYGREIVKDNCDLRKGQFVLKVSQNWSDGTFVLLSEQEARAWFERWCPDETNKYADVFGSPENPWTGDGAVSLVEQAERSVSSMKWDKERAEERAKKAEAELEALKAQLEALKAQLEPPTESPGVPGPACGEA